MGALPLLVLMLVTGRQEPAAVGATGSQAKPPPAPQTDAAVDEIVVVTASRREEQLLNAPATMTVITDDMLGVAPSQSVTDLLRLVPGLNTVQTSARDVNVTSRGATSTLSDSMLVLIDGRSIYQDFFGSVLWDFLPVDSAEIKQVEVIRGPASAVWGANAMTGVVNVVSKTPRELAGNTVAIRFGQFDRSPPGGRFDGGGLFAISAIHAAAVSSRFAYKISAGLLAQEAFLRPTGVVPGTQTPFPAFVNQGTNQPKIDARADYDVDRQQKLVVAGGVSATEGIIHTGLGPLDAQRGSRLSYTRAAYSRGNLKVQAFVNALHGDASAVLLSDAAGRPLIFRFENHAYDVEFSNFRLLAGHHLVSYGANFRHNQFTLSFAPRGTARDEGGAYVQDTIFFSEHLRWIIGARADRFDVLHKVVFSPRTALLIKPRGNQTFRLSFNRAFRAPSLVNTFLETGFVNRIDLGAAGTFAFPTVAVGNEQLQEERLSAYEAGYIGGFGRTTLGAAFYVSRTNNMIQFTQTGAYTSGDPPAGWPLPAALLDQLSAAGRGLPSQFSYRNFSAVTDRGVELSAEVRASANASAFANYSWQAQPSPAGFALSELNLPPTHRFNAGMSAEAGRFFGSVSGSFIDGAYWQDVLPGFQGSTGAYTLVDGAVGVNSPDRTMTIAVRGNNLLNRPVQQHVFGDVIRRTLTGEVRFRF
jgi:outer membrane receptor protein involved in Fe transport